MLPRCRLKETSREVSSFGMLDRQDQVCEAAGDDEEEDGEEDGVLFHINKSGFPVCTSTWERMWNHVARIHPDGYNMTRQIRNNINLPEIPIQQVPQTFSQNVGIPERLQAMQKYMCDLQYNHTGTQFYEIKKNRPLTGLMDTAKEMIREALPIKCLEAVILALYLTLGFPGVDRFPLSFRSTFNGHTHRHVVLGIYFLGKYGALGMSRRKDLMYKPLIYKSLSDLVKDYKRCYENYLHEVKVVAVGLPVPHDPHSYESINWRELFLSISKMTTEDLCKEVERHSRDMRARSKRWEAISSVYNPPKMRPISTGHSPHPVRKSMQTSNKHKPKNKVLVKKADREPSPEKSKPEREDTDPVSVETSPDLHSHDTTPEVTSKSAHYEIRI